jgi:Uncharacterised nucleotidyltransferase
MAIGTAGPARGRHRAADAAGPEVVSRALVDICRGGVPDLGPDPAVRDALGTAVRHHRIAPLAHVVLRDHDPLIAEMLRPDRDAALAMHLRAAVTLDHLGRLLGEVPWATFKGPVLSELAHPVPGLRTYRDLDLLVDPADLREVTIRFAAQGWQVVDLRDTLALPLARGEMHWRTDSGLVIDLHWSMLNVPDERRTFRVPTGDLLSRRRRVRLGFADAITLNPVDAFVHLCLHAAISGGDRMQYLLDLEQVARTLDRWDEVEQRAQEWHVGIPVGLVLGRTRAVLRSSRIPPEVVRRLGGPALLRLVTGTTDRLVPVPRLRREASFPRLVSRAARDTGGATAAALIRKTFMAATPWLRPPRVDPEDTAPADARTLEDYLRKVEVEITNGVAPAA